MSINVRQVNIVNELSLQIIFQSNQLFSMHQFFLIDTSHSEHLFRKMYLFYLEDNAPVCKLNWGFLLFFFSKTDKDRYRVCYMNYM